MNVYYIIAGLLIIAPAIFEVNGILKEKTENLL